MKCIETEKLDLAVLDIMLPDVDGLSICRTIREKRQNYPVILLTAKVEDVDKITGLVIGADDYITKPFNPPGSGGRVKAQLRRYKNITIRGRESGPLISKGYISTRTPMNAR